MNRSILADFIKTAPLLTEDSAIFIADQFEFKGLKKGDRFIKAGRIPNEYMFLE